MSPSTPPSTASIADEQPSLERIRQLVADVDALRGELARKDAALAQLAERLVDVEAAREEGARHERDARVTAELELSRLEATKLYRLALKPRDVLYRRRQRLG